MASTPALDTYRKVEVQDTRQINANEYPFIGDVDLKTIVFGTRPETLANGSQKVSMSIGEGQKKLQFSLCSDAIEEPVQTKWGLDSPIGGADNHEKSRIGQAVIIHDERVRQVLKELDTIVVDAAIKSEWFKGKNDEQQIRDRYVPLLTDKEDGQSYAKFKIKFAPGIPTRFFIYDKDTGMFDKHPRTVPIEYLRVPGAYMAPLLMIFGLWISGLRWGIGMQAEQMLYTPPLPPDPFAAFTTKRCIPSGDVEGSLKRLKNMGGAVPVADEGRGGIEKEDNFPPTIVD